MMVMGYSSSDVPLLSGRRFLDGDSWLVSSSNPKPTEISERKIVLLTHRLSPHVKTLTLDTDRQIKPRMDHNADKQNTPCTIHKSMTKQITQEHTKCKQKWRNQVIMAYAQGTWKNREIKGIKLGKFHPFTLTNKFTDKTGNQDNEKTRAIIHFSFLLSPLPNIKV
jgi:hypothetical protein